MFIFPIHRLNVFISVFPVLLPRFSRGWGSEGNATCYKVKPDRACQQRPVGLAT